MLHAESTECRLAVIADTQRYYFCNLLTKHIFSSHSPPFWQLQILLLLASKRTADLVKHNILAHRYGQMNRADNTHLLFISLKDLA